MASPGEKKEDEDQKKKKSVHIEETKHLQVARNVGVISSLSVHPENAPKIVVQTHDPQGGAETRDGRQDPVDLDITVERAENVQDGDNINSLVMLKNCDLGKPVQSYPPLTTEGEPVEGSDDLEPDGRLPSLVSSGTADKSTDTSNDGMPAWGYRMGVTDRLHFCYLQGPDFVQIANCCTYIEVNINDELVQNIRSQGCLSAEVANSQSLVTFKWGSLEEKREYIRCGLKAKLQDNYKCLENEIIESLLGNSDQDIEKIVKLFLKNEASLLEIVNGCLVFKVLVPDVEAKDRLFSSDSLRSIAKFLEDLLITKTIREKAGHQQVLFHVTPLSDWSQMRPCDMHMFRFNTSVPRESSRSLTDVTLRELIQTIVSQELQKGLSNIQRSLADTVATAVSTEMQKFKTSEQELIPQVVSPDNHSPGPGTLAQESPSPGPGTLAQESPIPGAGTLVQQSPSQGPGTLAQQSPSPGPGTLAQESSSPGPGTLAQQSPSPGPGTLAQESPSPGPGTLAQESPSPRPKSSSLEGLSHRPGSSPVGYSSQRSKSSSASLSSQGDLSTSISSPHWSGNISPNTRPPVPPHPDSARALKKRDASKDGLQHTRMKRSFASILFNQQDWEHLWPDPVKRTKAEEFYQLKGSYEPLDVDLQLAVQCVRKLVDIPRLAKLMFQAVIPRTSELSQAPGLNTVLCLDVSDSMKTEPLKELVQCVKRLGDEIEDSTNISLEENVGVVLFGGDVRIQLLPTNDYQKLQDTVTNLETGGDTSPMLEAILASILLLFQTNKVPDPYFTIGENHCYRLYPRIILMSDGLTTEGGQTRGMDSISYGLTTEVSDAVCKFLPMLLKASCNKCRINCVQFKDKSKKSDTMKCDTTDAISNIMETLSVITGGDIVDPTQIEWLSHYFRRQNAIGKVIDWCALPENKEASDSEKKERIKIEFRDCEIEDPNEQRYVTEAVFEYDISGSNDEDFACASSASIIELQEPDFLSGRQHVLKPGDQVRKGPEWNEGQNTSIDSGSERGTVISYNQKDGTVKVKWANGVEDYYQEDQILLEDVTEHQQKPQDASNVQDEDFDLQVDCDPCETGNHDLSLREVDGTQRQHSLHSVPFAAERISGGQVTDLNHKIVWQRKVKGDNWVIYSSEQIDVIEKAYTSHQQSCVISSPNTHTRYHLDFINLQSTNLSDMSCSEIRRSEMTQQEYAHKIDVLAENQDPAQLQDHIVDHGWT